MSVLHPWVLALLPLSLAPLFFQSQQVLPYSMLGMIPPDRLSTVLGIALRVAAAAAIAILVMALSGPYRPAQTVQRIGQGAQMILLLDRSRSMDQPFAGPAFGNPLATKGFDSKGKVARRLLSEFVADRNNDLFGMLAFSTYPIRILPLTDKQAVIQAAIAAGNIGKGLSETDVGAGLMSAVKFFEGQPYTGSRIVLLVSDGGARLDLATQIELENLFRRHRVALYWIYIRSRISPGIFGEDDGATAETAPERLLHRFFQDMGSPYRAYTAENPDALKDAIAAVNRLQNLPIRYQELIPRRDLSGLCYGLALVMLSVLIIAKLLELRTWH